MSFNESISCTSGLTTAIYYAFDAYDNKDLYNPTKVLKFSVATTKLSEASNTVYA